MKAKVPHWRQLLSWRWGNYQFTCAGAGFQVLFHEAGSEYLRSECAAVSKRVWCAIKQ